MLPVPMLGVLAFALLFASTLLARPSARARVATPLGLCVFTVGAILVGLQAYIGHFCSLCMIVDSCALLIGVATIALRNGGFEGAASEEASASGSPHVMRLPLRSWVLLSVIAVLGPLFYPLLVRKSEVPAVIRGMYASQSLTVLEFFDFQCPHCQDLSPRLARLVKADPEFTLKYGYTPLPGHPDAREAARHAICAGEQGKEHEVVQQLFEVRDFSPDVTRRIAAEIVPDRERLAACLDSKRADERIESDTESLKKAGFVGLPTTYVGGIRILGADEDLAYRDAMRRVREGGDEKGLNPKIYWAGILLLALAVVLMGRLPSGESTSKAG